MKQSKNSTEIAYETATLSAFLPGVIVVMLLMYVSAVLFGPILKGIDTTVDFFRLDTWSAALKAGDLISTWTPTDANGFGSPVPFFYHKLFNLAGAALTLATGDIVIAFRISVLFFSAIMFYGVYLCAGRLGADRLGRLVVAVACIFSPYALDCVVVRSSVAEYAAMALVPFILALVIDFYKGTSGKWHGVFLFFLMLLLALAHALIFVLAAGLLLLLTPQLIIRSPSGRWPFPMAIMSALVLFVTLIYVPFTYWAQYFCPAQAKIFGSAADNLLSLKAVFLRGPRPIDPRSGFGWPVFALVIGICAELRQPGRARTSLAFWLGLVALGLILLTTRFSRPLWQISGQLDFIQFPWRLLAIFTPICLVALAGVIESLSPATKRSAQFGILAMALSHTLYTQYLNSHTFVRLPLAEVRHEAPSTDIEGPDAGGEYFPAAFQQAIARIKVWYVPPASVLPVGRPMIEASGCTYEDIARPVYFNELRISTTCSAPGRLRVNQFSTPFLQSIAIDNHGTTVQPLAHSQVVEFALPAGHWTISVRKRSYVELVVMAWRARLWKSDT